MTRRDELKLGDFIDVVNGYAFKSSDFLNKEEDGCLPVVKIKNVASGTVRLADTQYHKLNENLSKYLINRNDILIALTGNHPQAITQVVGEVARYNFDKRSLLNQRVAKVVPKENIDSDYLYYFLKDDTTHDYLASQSSGSGNQANISKKDIENIIFNPPNLTKQKAIASVLSSLDNKIYLLRRQNKTLEAMSEALFREWFVVNAKQEWKEVKIKEIAEVKIGRTPPRKESKWFSKSSDDMKWLSIKDLGEEGAFTLETSERLTKDAFIKFNIPVIPANTVVLSFKMTVGRVKITVEDMLSNEAIAHFKIKNKVISNEYLFLYLKSYNYDILGTTSSIVTSINSAMIKDMEIIVPDKELADKFNKIVKSLFNKIKTNQQQIKTLATLRDNLLPRLMSGDTKMYNNGRL